MCYPRFTKVIIDYSMSKDQSISKRNKMFWHTARDDAMFKTIKVISRNQYTHIYDAILSDVLTNQEMLDSKAYKEYYAVASGAIPSKAKTKYKKKTDEPVTSLKSKTASSSKGTRLKSKAKVTKPDIKKQPAKKTKVKGLAVLSEVALSKAEQIKLATKRSKKDFYISHASGSGNGVDTQSKVLDKQEQKTSGTDEGTDTIPEVLDVHPYESESDTESWGESEDEGDNDDDDQTEYEEEDVDEGAHTPSDDELTDEEKLVDEETIDDKENDEVLKELYEDVNVNLEKDDAEMTNANQGGSEQQNVSQESGFEQEEKDAHVTLTPNPSLTDNKIASLMETSAPHVIATSEITSGFTTTYQAKPTEKHLKEVKRIFRYLRGTVNTGLCDGTLNDVWTALYDIATGIRMKYLPMRKWSNLDKKRAQVMVQDIDKQLYQRRLMRNLEKFVCGIPYREDLRLLERTI
nr:hypothetical protein [Tanacetum cinerariifolium]